jgi:hypothetical protein
MAEHMQTFLGSMLYTDPIGEDIKALPSPEELKRKILVKAKKLPPGIIKNTIVFLLSIRQPNGIYSFNPKVSCIRLTDNIREVGTVFRFLTKSIRMSVYYFLSRILSEHNSNMVSVGYG